MRRYARHFFDYAVSDLARHQLMNQRTLPGFEPTPESYAPAVAVLEQFRARLAGLGLTRQEDADLCVALVGGLIDAQLANDPGGDRWARLLDHAVDMFADHVASSPSSTPGTGCTPCSWPTGTACTPEPAGAATLCRASRPPPELPTHR